MEWIALDFMLENVSKTAATKSFASHSESMIVLPLGKLLPRDLQG
jgi:hypothetical protein